MTGRGFTQPLMWNNREGEKKEKQRWRGEDRVWGGKDRKKKEGNGRNRGLEREREIRTV